MFSKSFRFSALLLALGFVLSLALAGCSDTERDNGNGPKPTPTPTTTDLRVDFSQISDSLFSGDVPVPSKVDTSAVKVEFCMTEAGLGDVQFEDISEDIDENNVYDAGLVDVGEDYDLFIRFTDRASDSVVGRVMMTVTAEDNDGQCVVVLKDEDVNTTTDLLVDFSQISDNLFYKDVPVQSKVDTTAVKVEFFMDEVTEEEVTPEYTDISEQIDENNVYNAGPVAVGKEYRLDVRFSDRESGKVVGQTELTVTAEDQDGQCIVVLEDEDVNTAKITFVFSEVLPEGINTVAINGKTYEISDGQAMVTVDELAQLGTNLFDIEAIAPQQEGTPRYGTIAVAYDYPVEVTDIHSDVTVTLVEEDFEFEIAVTFTFDEAATAKLDQYGTPTEVASEFGVTVPLTKNEEGLYTFEFTGALMGLEEDLNLTIVDEFPIATVSLEGVHYQPENHELHMDYTIDESQVIPFA